MNQDQIKELPPVAKGDIKEWLRRRASHELLMMGGKLAGEIADHIATIEQERNQYRMAADEEAKFADEYKAESAANLQRALVAEKDVERYKWLKDNADIILHKESMFSCNEERYQIYSKMPCSAEVDSAVDYSMADTSTQSTDQQNVSINGGNIDVSREA